MRVFVQPLRGAESQQAHSTGAYRWEWLIFLVLPAAPRYQRWYACFSSPSSAFFPPSLPAVCESSRGQTKKTLDKECRWPGGRGGSHNDRVSPGFCSNQSFADTQERTRCEVASSCSL